MKIKSIENKVNIGELENNNKCRSINKAHAVKQ